MDTLIKILTQKHIINAVSIFSTVSGVVILIFCWNDLNTFRKILIFSFIVLFIYWMFNNLNAQKQASKRMYFPIRQPVQRRKGPYNQTIKKLQEFFSQRKQKYQPDFYQENKKPWNRNFLFSSNKLINEESSQRYYTQKAYSSQKAGGNIFITQNVSTQFQQMKKKIKPKIYWQRFCFQIDKLKKAASTANKQKSQFQQQSPSLFLDKNNKLRLQKDYPMFVQNPQYCTEVISDFLQSKLQMVITQFQANFRRISQIMIKTFGLQINFNKNKRNDNDFYFESITILELRQMLIEWRKNSIVPQKFKPKIPIKEFMQKYFNQLTQKTQFAWKFVSYNGKDQDLALRMYVYAIEQQFEDIQIYIRENISFLQKKSEKMPHVFLVHNIGSDISFSYNRILKFMTSNPLVAIMAFFAQDFRAKRERSNSISRSLERFYKNEPLKE